MFQDNLKTIRKNKGITQEELATKLNVVRQTISKWEKGLSVPDSDLLIRLAEILEVNVSQLLGSKVEEEQNQNELAQQLSHLNEQLAIKNNRSKKLWKTIAIVLLAIILVRIILFILLSVFNAMPTTKTNSFKQQYEIVQNIT